MRYNKESIDEKGGEVQHRIQKAQNRIKTQRQPRRLISSLYCESESQNNEKKRSTSENINQKD